MFTNMCNHDKPKPNRPLNPCDMLRSSPDHLIAAQSFDNISIYQYQFHEDTFTKRSSGINHKLKYCIPFLDFYQVVHDIQCKKAFYWIDHNHTLTRSPNDYMIKTKMDYMRLAMTKSRSLIAVHTEVSVVK